MRKRSSYRPRPVLRDAMAHVKTGFARVKDLTDADLSVRIINHGALKSIIDGTGTRVDADVLIAALNLTDALARLRIGEDYSYAIDAGQAALLACCRRSLERGKLLFTGLELSAINLAMEVHDAQLDLATVADIERALDIVNAEFRAGRVTRIAVAA